VTTTHDPALVGSELLALTHDLGRPERDLVILAEGNTSQRLDDGRIVVKASGARMRDVTADDFVVVDVEPLVELITDSSATQADLTAALLTEDAAGNPRRGSIETLVHAAVQAVAPAAYVGHTHPTEVVGLMASARAEESFAQAAYSDEAVVLGKPLFVPYAQPGIDLGRVYHRCLVEYADREGGLPQLVLLANHGIVAIAPTAEGVDGISEMAVKAAAVRRIAYSVGGLAPLTPEAVDKFFARDDISERRGNIAAGRL
jgi:rhamnose utilization protein RhaD (predicted bifunctional aldolase and dehydrogenase)